MQPANPLPLDAAARAELARKAERVVAHGAEPWIPAASFSEDGYSDDVAQFLAACSPKRILALLAAVERGEAETKKLRRELKRVALSRAAAARAHPPTQEPANA